MRALLQAWLPGEAPATFAKRVQRDDLVGKATARTVKDYTLAFTSRFLTPTDAPVRHVRRLLLGTVSRHVVNDLLFYYTAAQERLLCDFTTLHYWPAAREGRLALAVQDVRQFIWEAEQDGRIPVPWSSDVHRDLPARVLRILSDFGLLGQLRAGHRDLLPYRPADETLVYVVHLLHFDGVPDSALAEHGAWARFGLEPQDVWHRLDTLAGDEWFILQRAGQVVRITWQHAAMDEVVDALAGR